jgi:hypothetical protein
MRALFSEDAAMSARRNPILQQTLAALKAADAEGIEVWHGGKYIRVRYVHQSREVSTTVALSPRNPWRAQRNHLAQLARMLRAVEKASSHQPVLK